MTTLDPVIKQYLDLLFRQLYERLEAIESELDALMERLG